MPIFEFKCEKCEKVFEELTSFNKIDSVLCSCGNEHVSRIPSSFSSHIKQKSSSCSVSDRCAAVSDCGVPPCHLGSSCHGS